MSVDVELKSTLGSWGTRRALGRWVLSHHQRQCQRRLGRYAARVHISGVREEGATFVADIDVVGEPEACAGGEFGARN
jgi:hypothetical protein